MPPLGFEVKHVHVTGVDDATGYAMVRDRLGKEQQVSIRVVRVNLTPAEGELWIIDQSLGFWTFAAKVLDGPAGP